MVSPSGPQQQHSLYKGLEKMSKVLAKNPLFIITLENTLKANRSYLTAKQCWLKHGVTLISNLSMLALLFEWQGKSILIGNCGENTTRATDYFEGSQQSQIINSKLRDVLARFWLAFTRIIVNYEL